MRSFIRIGVPKGQAYAWSCSSSDCARLDNVENS